MQVVFTNPVFLVFAFLTVINVAWAVSHYLSKYHQAAFDANLKQEMLNQGMSADDIVKVLQASSNSPESVLESSRTKEGQEVVASKV
jgi:hypothetical protein